jgi:sensor histidine kinase regulating citrate/malate metabolism
VLGLDDQGMIAFVNGAAARLFQHSGALLGMEAAAMLPGLAWPAAQHQPNQQHPIELHGQRHVVQIYPMGQQSASRGALLTVSRAEGTI